MKKISAILLTAVIISCLALIASTLAVVVNTRPTLSVDIGMLNAQDPVPTSTPTVTPPPPVDTYVVDDFISFAGFNFMQGQITNDGSTVSFPNSNVTVGKDYQLLVTIRNAGNGTAIIPDTAFLFSGNTTILTITPGWEQSGSTTIYPFTRADYVWNVHVNAAGTANPSLTVYL
jgi:hypothetical protein